MALQFPKSWRPFVAVIMCKSSLCILEADAGCSGWCRFHWAESLLATMPMTREHLQDVVHDAGSRNASEGVRS